MARVLGMMAHTTPSLAGGVRSLSFLKNGKHVVAHERRGHDCSAQVSDSHDMNHYATDAAVVVEHLDLSNTVHIKKPR